MRSSKSDARWDGKQDFFLFGLIINTLSANLKIRNALGHDISISGLDYEREEQIK